MDTIISVEYSIRAQQRQHNHEGVLGLSNENDASADGVWVYSVIRTNDSEWLSSKGR
jgi:hypothetical protein